MELEIGLYRHYKGNMYEVLSCAQHSETQEWMVVYRALYGKKGNWVRPYTMFVEDVEYSGIKQRRFKKIKEGGGRCVTK